jgi:hypothetical protein
MSDLFCKYQVYVFDDSDDLDRDRRKRKLMVCMSLIEEARTLDQVEEIFASYGFRVKFTPSGAEL